MLITQLYKEVHPSLLEEISESKFRSYLNDSISDDDWNAESDENSVKEDDDEDDFDHDEDDSSHQVGETKSMNFIDKYFLPTVNSISFTNIPDEKENSSTFFKLE